MSHVTAREEVQALLVVLRLPIDERGRRRASVRDEWLANAGTPLEVGDVLAD